MYSYHNHHFLLEFCNWSVPSFIFDLSCSINFLLFLLTICSNCFKITMIPPTPFVCFEDCLDQCILASHLSAFHSAYFNSECDCIPHKISSFLSYYECSNCPEPHITLLDIRLKLFSDAEEPLWDQDIFAQGLYKFMQTTAYSRNQFKKCAALQDFITNFIVTFIPVQP